MKDPDYHDERHHFTLVILIDFAFGLITLMPFKEGSGTFFPNAISEA